MTTFDARRPNTTTTRVIGLIADHRAAIARLCDRDGVGALDVFGSAATGAVDNEASDEVSVARFADTSPGFANRYLDFAEAMERLFGRPVDVMFDRRISNPYLRRSVASSRVKVVERAPGETAV